MKKIRNCHFVPQVYQKEWIASENKIYYYTSCDYKKIIKDGNTSGLYNPEKQMFIKDYYHSELEEINFLETFFSTRFESDWKSIIEEITSKINNEKYKGKVFSVDKDSIDSDKLNKLLEFMAIQFFRIYENAEESILNAVTIFSKVVPESLVLITDEEFLKEVWRAGLIDSSKDSLPEINLLSFFKRGKIRIYKTKNSSNVSFILSDNPVVRLNDSDSEGCSYIFPISPNVCIEINNSSLDDLMVMIIDDEDVKKLNYFLSKNASYVFGYNKKMDDILDVFPHGTI